MPSHYWYRCTECDYRAFRYRNVKNCPDCGGRLVREETAPRAGNSPASAGEPGSSRRRSLTAEPVSGVKGKAD